MTEHRTPLLAGSSGEDSPNLAGWGIAASLGGLGDKRMIPYREQLLDPRWQRLRLEVLEAARWECQNCGASDKTLHVHHKRYVKGRKVWEYAPEELESLCKDCHKAHHDERELLDRLLADAPLSEIIPLLAGFLDAGEPRDDEARTALIGECMDCYPPNYWIGAIAWVVGTDRKCHLELADLVQRCAERKPTVLGNVAGMIVAELKDGRVG